MRENGRYYISRIMSLVLMMALVTVPSVVPIGSAYADGAPVAPVAGFDVRTTNLLPASLLSPNSVSTIVGSPVAMAGYVDLASDTQTARANIVITPTIRESVPGAPTTTLPSITTDSNGSFAFSYTPARAGVFQISLTAPGTTSLEVQFFYYPIYANFTATFQNSHEKTAGNPFAGFQGSLETVTVTVYQGDISANLVLPNETVTVRGVSTTTNSSGIAQFVVGPLTNS
jgi:hypothetical protein